MNAHIRKVYVPMTETGFYILLCLREEMHGYSIVQRVAEMTGGEVRLSPGTMYGSLSKMEKDATLAALQAEIWPCMKPCPRTLRYVCAPPPWR